MATYSGTGGTAANPGQQLGVLTPEQLKSIGKMVTRPRQSNKDNRYQRAVEAYYRRTEDEIAAYRKQLEQKRVDLRRQAAEAKTNYDKLANQFAEEQMYINAATGRGSRPDTSKLRQLQAAMNEATQKMNSTAFLSQQVEQNWIKDFQKFSADKRANYKRIEGLAGQINARNDQQAKYDADYAKARKDYENAVTQHDKDRAAYEMYKAQKSQYDQDAAQRQADIDAGRYAVNPYLFMAQGASLPEIEELRKQMNEGNLRPNMRVPTAPEAPKEVVDPGDFETAMPEHQTADDVYVSKEDANILGYAAPEERKPDEPLPEISTEKTDTSSVTSNYESPETTPDKPTEAEKKVTPQQTNTLQQTSSSAQGSTTQTTPQTASQPQAQPEQAPQTSLPEQDTGSVAGQQSSSGQAPQQQPQEEQEAKPFAEDNKEEDKDNVWATAG